MPTNSGDNYASTCALIEQRIRELDGRIKTAEAQSKLIAKFKDDMVKCETNVGALNGVLNELKPMLADVQDYINQRKKNSMQNINNALRLAGEVIPDSADGIYFKFDDDEAWLSTADGLEVDSTEGGGYRQISSNFVASVVLSANSENLQTMFLDEIFGLVSTTNSATLSLYLNIICKNMQIISIEQKPQVYSNIDHTVYQFNKIGEYTEISKSEVKREVSEQDAVVTDSTV